jgi:hypothetical protein
VFVPGKPFQPSLMFEVKPVIINVAFINVTTKVFRSIVKVSIIRVSLKVIEKISKILCRKNVASVDRGRKKEKKQTKSLYYKNIRDS